MEAKWKKYYSEMFRTYRAGFFTKMWGDHLDEWGEEYEVSFEHELEDMEKDFASFMYLFNKYNIEYNRDSVAMKIIDMFEELGNCKNVKGAYEMADMVIHAIKIKIGFNNTWHPEGRPTQANSEIAIEIKQEGRNFSLEIELLDDYIDSNSVVFCKGQRVFALEDKKKEAYKTINNSFIPKKLAKITYAFNVDKISELHMNSSSCFI